MFTVFIVVLTTRPSQAAMSESKMDSLCCASELMGVRDMSRNLSLSYILLSWQPNLPCPYLVE